MPNNQKPQTASSTTPLTAQQIAQEIADFQDDSPVEPAPEPAPKPKKRPKAEILSDIKRETAVLGELNKKCAIDQRKHERSKTYVKTCREAWERKAKAASDEEIEPWDPEDFHPPAIERPIDEDLHERHWAQHHVIRDLETELALHYGPADPQSRLAALGVKIEIGGQ